MKLESGHNQRNSTPNATRSLLRVLMFLLLLAFVAKPTLRICSSLFDVKCEFTETIGEEDTEEEEKEVDDLEDADKLFSGVSDQFSVHDAARFEQYQKYAFDYREFDPGVLLPPPKSTLS